MSTALLPPDYAPQVLGLSSSSGLAIMILEVMICKFGFYVAQVAGVVVVAPTTMLLCVITYVWIPRGAGRVAAAARPSIRVGL